MEREIGVGIERGREGGGEGAGEGGDVSIGKLFLAAGGELIELDGERTVVSMLREGEGIEGKEREVGVDEVEVGERRVFIFLEDEIFEEIRGSSGVSSEGA